MSLFNEKLKNIALKELLSLIILLFILQYFLNSFNIINFNSIYVYVVVIFYFIFKLRGNFPDKFDFYELFSSENLKHILIVVLLNIFLSYGFLYLSQEILNMVPSFNFYSIINLELISTIVVSPIAEELIFRGSFLNRLQLVVPTTFAVLISSLIFASLHTFGSLTSAFIFGVCMAVLYLKTENIIVPIFAHFLNNLLAELIRIIDCNNLLFTSSSVMEVMSILAIISFLAICYWIVSELKESINNNKL